MTRAEALKFKRDAFAETHAALSPLLQSVDAAFMANIEFCEVAEAYQRFRDFLHQLEAVRLKVACSD